MSWKSIYIHTKIVVVILSVYNTDLETISRDHFGSICTLSLYNWNQKVPLRLRVGPKPGVEKWRAIAIVRGAFYWQDSIESDIDSIKMRAN